MTIALSDQALEFSNLAFTSTSPKPRFDPEARGKAEEIEVQDVI